MLIHPVDLNSKNLQKRKLLRVKKGFLWVVRDSILEKFLREPCMMLYKSVSGKVIILEVAQGAICME